MAFLIKNIFGGLTGSLGSYIFRNRYGKTVAYNKPVKQKVSKSAASMRARKKFALTVALAKEIISFTELKQIWQKSKLPGTSAYHKIIKFNNKLTSNINLTTNNKIIPGFNAALIKDIILEKKSVVIKFDQNELLSDFDANVFVICFFYDRRFILQKDFIIKSAKTKCLGKDVLLDNNFYASINSLPFNKYNKAIIYSALLPVNNQEKIISCYTKQIIL